MRILAIETTERIGSVAAFQDTKLVAETRLTGDQRSAQSLAPALAELLKQLQWRAADLDLIAVTSGPGSFTGLRIGVTTAKTLAYAADAEVLGVNTLEVIAAQAPLPDDEIPDDEIPDDEINAKITAVIDAQRGQLYSASFVRESNASIRCVEETQIVDCADWLAKRQAGEVVTGPGLSRIAGDLPPGVSVVDPQDWAPRASTVGKLAAAHYENGRRDDVFQLAPQYYRPSAAEEKWNERQGPTKGSPTMGSGKAPG